VSVCSYPPNYALKQFQAIQRDANISRLPQTELAAYAVQMGAVHKYDLTPDVTHLVVGDYNTPKYRFVARERPDVEPMTVGWIEAIRELWINDQEIDFNALQQEHKLPTFHSLKFSMTGCDDRRFYSLDNDAWLTLNIAAERLEIAEQVKVNGAVYEGDLTKAITHLISFRTEGAKYKAARSWGLQIVSIEWMRDSLERGMILDEKLYDPTLPVTERGKGAWDRTKPKKHSLGKRMREGSDGTEGGKRKLRRTASTKLNSQSDGIWGDIVGANMVPQVERSGVWETDDSGALSKALPKSKAPAGSNTTAILPSTIHNTPTKKGMFGGCRFFLYGFDTKKTEILQGHLFSHDADIANTVEELIMTPDLAPPRLFRVVAHDLPVSSFPPLPASQVAVETITFWWVERCLHHKRFENPSEHVVGRPFPTFPIDGFADGTMLISSSAFTGIDLLHFKKSVQLIGATYSEDMTPNSTVLVTKSMTAVRKDKFDHAQEWRVPIVTADWLWDSISAGKRLPFSKYKSRSQKRSGSLPSTGATLPEGSSQGMQTKKDISQPLKVPNNSTRTEEKSRQQSAIDRSAFDPTEATTKNENPSQISQPLTESSNSTSAELSYRSEPLSERNENSPSRTVSTAPAPSCHPAPLPPPPDLSNEISNLLSKAKATKTSRPKEKAEVRKRTNRILGRATSGGNVSVTSSSLSRATSVDSTATSGHPADYPPTLKDQMSNERMEMLLNNEDRNRIHNDESQLSMTQLQYVDTDALEARELVLARMMGESDEGRQRRNGLKEKAVTMADLVGSVNPKRSSKRSGKGGLR